MNCWLLATLPPIRFHLVHPVSSPFLPYILLPHTSLTAVFIFHPKPLWLPSSSSPLTFPLPRRFNQGSEALLLFDEGDMSPHQKVALPDVPLCAGPEIGKDQFVTVYFVQVD